MVVKYTWRSPGPFPMSSSIVICLFVPDWVNRTWLWSAFIMALCGNIFASSLQQLLQLLPNKFVTLLGPPEIVWTRLDVLGSLSSATVFHQRLVVTRHGLVKVVQCSHCILQCVKTARDCKGLFKSSGPKIGSSQYIFSQMTKLRTWPCQDDRELSDITIYYYMSIF